MKNSFYFVLTFDTLDFDAVEQAYLKGIKRLKKKVNTEIHKFNRGLEHTRKKFEPFLEKL